MDDTEFEKHERLEANHWWFEGRRRCIEAVLATRLKPVALRRILDVGCGTGGMFPLLQRFGSVSGAEFSSDARARCQRLHPEVSVAPCALPDQVPEGPYELITAFDVLEHLDAPHASAQALAQRLTDGGQLLATVPAFPLLFGPHDVALHHRRRYTRRLLLETLEGSGLRVTYESFFNTALFPLQVAARLLARLRTGEHRAPSDLGTLWSPLNRGLKGLFAAESLVMRAGRLPAGMSLIALAEKP